MIDEKNPILNPQAEGSNAVFSSKGKEVIRSNHSEQIITLKNQLQSFQFSEITQVKITKKTNKAIDSIDTNWSTMETLATGVAVMIPGLNLLTTSLIKDETNCKLRIAKEKMPEVVRKLVNTAISDLEKQKKELVDNLTDLSKEVRERENGLLSEIERLTQEIMDKNEILQRGEKAIKEARKRAEAEIREGKTVDSKAIVDLKTTKQRIDELEIEIIQLRKNRNDLLFVIDGQDIKILDKEKEVERKQKERDNAIENLEIRNKELKTETQAKRDLEKEKIDWETKRKNKKEKIANLKKKVNDLEKELKKHEPSMLYQVADKLGIIQLKNSISNVLIIAGAVVVLYAISWMWKYLVKPTYRNFKGDDENEPQPRRKERVKYEDYEEISEEKEKPQSLPEKQPTIIINNSTPAEKEGKSPAMVSKGEVKQEKILTQISSDTIAKEKEPQETEKAESEQGNKNSKKNGSAKKNKK